MSFRRSCLLLLIPILFLGNGCRLFRGGKKSDPVPTPTPVPLSDFRRTPRASPVADFERIAGWRASSETGDVVLSKGADKAVWGAFGAELRFVPHSPGPHKIRLIPDQPWMVRSPFSDYALWIRQSGKVLDAPHTLRILGRDAGGGLRAWDLEYRPQGRWQYLHGRESEQIPWPLAVERLEWRIPEGAQGEQVLWMDNLMIYQEVVGRIPQGINAVRPHEYAPAFAPVRKNSVQLDFPTSKHAFLPQGPSERAVVKSERENDRTFRFDYQDRTMSISYRVHADPGSPRLTAWSDGQEAQHTWEWTDVRLEGLEGAPELRYAHLRDDRLWLQYTDGFSCEFRLVGRTLQIELNSQSEQVSRLHLGSLRLLGSEQARKLEFPYLQMDQETPWPILTWTQGERNWMLSCFPDWWYSMASHYRSPAAQTDAAVTALGSMDYDPRWRGGRNVFRERLYLTLGQRIEDVLPAPAHPVAMYRESLEDLLLVEGDSETYWQELNQGSDRYPVEPSRLLSLLPIDEAWEENQVARRSSGDWLAHPGGGWVRKTARLDEASAIPEREQAWGTPWMEAEWFRFPPWRFLDSDVRMPGAGTYAQSWAELGAYSQQLSAETGSPLVGQGGAEWFWAGLASGFTAEEGRRIQDVVPILPHVSRGMILPGSALLGIGSPEQMTWPGEVLSEGEKVDRLLALQIAYGATGKVAYSSDFEAYCRAYRILSVLHPRVGRQGVDRIAYWDGARFLDMGEALVEGALTRSQIYIRLQDATEIWVNGDTEQDWQVRVDGKELKLPPFGFVVRGEDFFVLRGHEGESGLLAVVEHGEGVWLQSPEDETGIPGLEAHGCVYVDAAGAPQVLEVTLCPGVQEIHIDPEMFGMDRVGTVELLDGEGRLVPEAALVDDEARPGKRLRNPESVRKIRIFREIRAHETKFVP